MSNVALYIATSLDGYIARSDGDIDWLTRVERAGEDYGYAAFYQSVGAVVMGSKTYELGLSFNEWPYPGKKVFVFTTRDLKSDREDVEFVSGDVKRVLTSIEARGFEKLWLIGGGDLTRSFQQQGLIDEYIISIIPLILGNGIRLFPPPGCEETIELIDSSRYSSGLVQMHYRQRRNA